MLVHKHLVWVGLALIQASVLLVNGADSTHAGFLYDDFKLTLAPGHRTEILGPIYSSEHADSVTQTRWTPLFSRTDDPDADWTEIDIAYPLLTYDRFGAEYRFQVLQWLSWAGGASVSESTRKRFTLFPFYFQQRSTKPEENYTALVPFHGRLVNRLFRDEVKFTLMPLYVQSRKKDVVTDNYVYPFFHLRHGDGLHGWQVWPLIGHEHKDVITGTDDFGDEQVTPGHDKWMALWPFIFHNNTGLGTTNVVHERAILPLYSLTRSPARDSSTVLWPFFTWTNDREMKYREWDMPYALVVFARGEGKSGNRVWPFYSHMTNASHESGFIGWPVYKYNRLNSAPLLRERTRWMFFLYSATHEENTTTHQYSERKDFWPLFTRRRETSGNERLQILAPVEPFLPASHSIERNYSPVWTLWLSERNGKSGDTSQSFLWNLYRRETSSTSSRFSVLFGLIQHESTPQGRHWRFFHLLGRKPGPGGPETSVSPKP